MLDDIAQAPENLLEVLSDREKSQLAGEGFLSIIQQSFSLDATPEQMAKSLGKLSESLKLNGVSIEQQSLITGAMANFAVEMRSPKSVRKFPVAEVRSLDLDQQAPAWNEQQVDQFQNTILKTAVVPNVGGLMQRAGWRTSATLTSTPLAKGGGAIPK